MKTTVLSDILKSVMTPFGTHGPLPLIEWQLMEVRQWPGSCKIRATVVGSPERIRTAVSALRGPRARPLHYGAMGDQLPSSQFLKTFFNCPNSLPNQAGEP